MMTTLPWKTVNAVFLTTLLSVSTGLVVDGRADEISDQKARIVADWLTQDCGPAAEICFTRADGYEVERQAVATALQEAANPQFQAELTELVAAKTPGNNPRWRNLYLKACEARRTARLSELIRGTPKIIFTKHYNLGGSHYAYTEGLSDAQAERHFVPGTALCVLDLEGGNAKVSTLIDDPDGVIRDPAVSYDGRRILFAWKKSDREDDYHLYEMEVATRAIRQLTFGLGFADYEGCYLPNGDILFTSTRCVQIVDCWWTEVSNLYMCDADGEFLRRVSFDQVHSNYPQVLPDGRVIYTRWDYNDRGQLYPQPLFQMNSDGTGQTEYYGNNSWFPTTIAHARPIAGSDKLIAIASGHHCIQTGALIVIDAKKGTHEGSGVTLVAPLVEDKSDRRYQRVDAYTGFDGHFGYPFAINEKEYVASYSADQTERDSKNGYGLVYVREDGVRELLVDDPEISCNQPVPLAARPLPDVRPSTVDYRQETGIYYVQNIYLGPGLKGVQRGIVKKLRVVALDFRAAGVGSNRNRGPAGSALVSTPISIANGTWDTKTVLGETPVYDDGSALFEVPARTPVYFQAVDNDGQVVQSMRSWSTLQPGETFSCVGCHEEKNTVGQPHEPTEALAAGAMKLEPFYGKPRGFSFNREIQPILNEHCIECHDDRSQTLALIAESDKKGSKKGTKFDFQGGAATGDSTDKKAFSLLSEIASTSGGRQWSDAYIALTQNGKPNPMVNWLNVQSVPPMLPPYFAGSAKSQLIALLREGHYDVKLSREELDKIACWIDLLVPFCGDYMEANAWDEEGVQKYTHYADKRKKMAAIERDNIEALVRRQFGDDEGVEKRENP